MKLLLDTHAMLWFVGDDHRLSSRAAAAMEAEDAELYFSPVTISEMAIKKSRGKLTLPSNVELYVDRRLREGFRLLALDWRAIADVEGLPWHHRDPFDRLLAAQSLREDITLVSRDEIFEDYGVKTLW